MLAGNNLKTKVIKILCLALTVATVISTFVACDTTGTGDGTGSTGGTSSSTGTQKPSDSKGTETGTSTGTGTDTETGEEVETRDYNLLLDEISDESVNWGGKKFTILCSGYNGDNLQELISEGSTGEPLSDKVYERNVMFQDKCNLQLAYVKAKDQADADFKAKREAQDGLGDLQYFTIDHITTANLAVEGLLYNFLDMGIDLKEEWWDQGTASFNLRNHVFFMNGTWNFSDDRSTWCMIFNKTAFKTQYPTEDLYKTVEDGEWTLDKFKTMISNFSEDNGDGVWDENDTYGFIATPHYSDSFFFGSGLRYTDMENGEDPTLALSNDRGMMNKASALVDKVLDIYGGDHATYRAAQFQTSYKMFKDNQGLFFGETVSYVINLNQEYEGQFGVLPVPKYDTEQQDYMTYTNGYSSTLSVPVNAKDGKKIGKIAEVFSIMSHQLVFPAFYNVVLTSKSVKDPQSVHMLDIIFKHRVYDIANYFSTLGLQDIFEKSAEGGNNNFSRDYARQKSGFSKNVRTLFAKLQ